MREEPTTRYIPEDSKIPFKCVQMYLSDILAGKEVEIDVDDVLDLPEELSPKIQVKISRSKESGRRLTVSFSCDYETIDESQVGCASMMHINRLTRYMQFPDRVKLEAQMIEETSNCTLVVSCVQEISNAAEEEHIASCINGAINSLLLLMTGMPVI